MSDQPAEGATGERFVVVSVDDAAEKGWCEPARGCDHWWCLFDTSTDPPTLLETDDGEPEDQSLVRDWKWVPVRMNELARANRDLRTALRDATATERNRVLAEIESVIDDWTYESDSDVQENVVDAMFALGVVVAGGDEGSGSERALEWLKTVEARRDERLTKEG